MTDYRCDDDLAELASGAIAGAERALALQHVMACGSCLRELAQLSRAADELLILAPGREPPAGFEAVVITRLVMDSRRTVRRPRGRFLVSLAVARLAAAFAAAAAWQASASDCVADDEQRAVPAVAGGTHFTALPITTDSGSRAGTVFFYEGNPSWLMISLSAAPVDGAYGMVLYDRDGASYSGEPCEVRDGVGIDGYRLFKPVSTIASMELTGPNGVRLSTRPCIDVGGWPF